MSDLHDANQKQRLSDAERQEASDFTLGIAMTAIAALFVAGIAAAFIYAKDTNAVLTAQAPKPAVTAHAPPETTGSGSAK